MEWLKREIQPPRNDLFEGVEDATWVGWLSDAFWEARLDGFLTGYTIEGGAIVPVQPGDADLDQRWIALIVLYAGVKVLRHGS